MLSSMGQAYLLPVQPLATPQGPHIHSNPDRRFYVFHVVSWLLLLSFLSCLSTATNDSHPALSWGSLPSAQADSWLPWWATPPLSVSVHHHGLVLSRSGAPLGRDEVLFHSPLQVLYSLKAHQMHALDFGCSWGISAPELRTETLLINPFHLSAAVEVLRVVIFYISHPS